MTPVPVSRGLPGATRRAQRPRGGQSLLVSVNLRPRIWLVCVLGYSGLVVGLGVCVLGGLLFDSRVVVELAESS